VAERPAGEEKTEEGKERRGKELTRGANSPEREERKGAWGGRAEENGPACGPRGGKQGKEERGPEGGNGPGEEKPVRGELGRAKGKVGLPSLIPFPFPFLFLYSNHSNKAI
jgi:hypothetical protein